jgi:hypothetical protein
MFDCYTSPLTFAGTIDDLAAEVRAKIAMATQ